MLPTRRQDSRPCIESRSGENACWAGGVPTRTPLKESGSSGDIFRERQRRSPDRYQPLQIRTLQRGMRKIRTYLLEARKEQWQESDSRAVALARFRCVLHRNIL